MGNKRLLKRIAINLSIIVINIIVFSKTFLGIQISSGNVLEAVFGIAVILLSILLFMLANTNLTKMKTIHEAGNRHNSNKSALDVFYTELKNYNKNKPSYFEKNLTVITKQITSFSKKKLAISKLLSEKFDVNEITHHKFSSAVENVETLFQANVENVINKIKYFDEADIDTSGKEVFQEYLKFMLKATEYNDEIILKLDKLILEISKLKDKIHDDIESMDAIKEIEQLIENTKLYKERRKDKTL
jgi:hypothetical protein